MNYSRWLPVFINDMKSLPEDVKEELPKNWVVQKTEKKFSAMPIDQAHEQNNAIVKGTGGAVGLTESRCFRQMDGSRSRDGATSEGI